MHLCIKLYIEKKAAAASTKLCINFISLYCNISSMEDTQANSKKRKVGEKTVVAVKINEQNYELGKQNSTSADSWSWRKYGQKPIKGSPYPRGYYRCSTSKGCLAKKQVERCRTDSSMLIITYTFSHNHPASTTTTQDPSSSSPVTHDPTHEQKLEPEQEEQNSSLLCNYESPPLINNVLVEEEPLYYPHLMNFTSSSAKSEEDDFYDELEELLPTTSSSSSYTSFMIFNLLEDRVLVNPSSS